MMTMTAIEPTETEIYPESIPCRTEAPWSDPERLQAFLMLKLVVHLRERPCSRKHREALRYGKRPASLNGVAHAYRDII
jgi:hypothetical protein